MDPNEEIEEINENPEATEEILGNDLEEIDDESVQSSSEPLKYGEKEYKNARDENGHHDKNYYKKRGQELDEKVDKAKEEKARNWKKKDPDADGSNTERKNRRDKLKDNINLERAKYDRMMNKLDNIKSKTYQTLHPVDAAKEAVKDKAKGTAKEARKAAAKTTGRIVASGAKAVLAFIGSNPILLGAVLVLVLVVVIFMFLFASDTSEYDDGGYFDTSCDFNLTTVNLKSCILGISNTMSIEDYVLGVVYAESEERNFSEEGIKALMIILKTNALANGNYDSISNRVVEIRDCDVKYTNISDIYVNDEKLKNLRDYYNEIDNYLFISETYKEEITSLSKVDALEYNSNILDKIANTNKTRYSSILEELYPNSKDAGVVTSNSNSTKPYIFVGDSRTAQMKNAVSELTNDNTIAEGSKEYNLFVNTAISKVTEKVNDGNSYNIISWLGVNDAADRSRVNKYFDKYKDLAEGTWSKHTIYVVSVGPVSSSYKYISQNGDEYTGEELNADIDYFNETMKSLINDAKISNLKFLNLNYNIASYDEAGLHYDTSDYQKIYNDIKNSLGESKTISKNKALYNNIDYCTYYKYLRDNCEVGWWWPVGIGSPQGGIYSKELTSAYTYLTRGFTKNITFTNRPHYGIDIGISIGNVVVASRSGTVIYTYNGCSELSNIHSTCGGGGGNWVKIDHGDGTASVYMHMGLNTIVVKKGQKVVQGQKLGLSSSTGSSNGPHLHFGILVNDTYIDPLQYVNADNTRPRGICKTGNYSNDKAGVCRALKDNDLSDNAVAGIMANIQNESGYDATLKVRDSNGLYSYGLMMWNGNNGKNLLNYCSDNWQDVKCQADFVIKYIEDASKWGNTFNAKPYVYGNYDAKTIAQYFCLKLERCQGCVAHSNGREVPGTRCIERGNLTSGLLRFVKNGCSN